MQPGFLESPDLHHIITTCLKRMPLTDSRCVLDATQSFSRKKHLKRFIGRNFYFYSPKTHRKWSVNNRVDKLSRYQPDIVSLKFSKISVVIAFSVILLSVGENLLSHLISHVLLKTNVFSRSCRQNFVNNKVLS